MKLGTETNSLVNHLYSRGVIGEPKPEVGMACTFLSWTDRSAGTIVAVRELAGKKYSLEIEATHDDYKLVGGSAMSEEQEYEYTSRQDGHRSTFRKLRETGLWIAVVLNPETGKMKKTCGGIRIGERETYRDPSF